LDAVAAYIAPGTSGTERTERQTTGCRPGRSSASVAEETWHCACESKATLRPLRCGHRDGHRRVSGVSDKHWQARQSRESCWLDYLFTRKRVSCSCRIH